MTQLQATLTNMGYIPYGYELPHQDAELIIQAVKEDGKTRVKKILTMADIMESVCECSGQAEKLIKSKWRKKEVALARQMFCFFARKEIHISLKQIGLFCGDRDHSTVIHSVQTINNGLTTKHLPTVHLYVKVLASIYLLKK